MNNRYDWTPQLVTYMAEVPFRCTSQTTRDCHQYNRPTVVVPQPLVPRVDTSKCPYPVSRMSDNMVEVVTYPPDAAYRDQWLCRVARWQQR